MTGLHRENQTQLSACGHHCNHAEILVHLRAGGGLAIEEVGLIHASHGKRKLVRPTSGTGSIVNSYC